jgi:hypothetical protein
MRATLKSAKGLLRIAGEIIRNPIVDVINIETDALGHGSPI